MLLGCVWTCSNLHQLGFLLFLLSAVSLCWLRFPSLGSPRFVPRLKLFCFVSLIVLFPITVETDEELGEGEGENCSLHSGDSDILYSDLENPPDPGTMPPPRVRLGLELSLIHI